MKIVDQCIKLSFVLLIHIFVTKKAKCFRGRFQFPFCFVRRRSRKRSKRICIHITAPRNVSCCRFSASNTDISVHAVHHRCDIRQQFLKLFSLFFRHPIKEPGFFKLLAEHKILTLGIKFKRLIFVFFFCSFPQSFCLFFINITICCTVFFVYHLKFHG